MKKALTLFMILSLLTMLTACGVSIPKSRKTESQPTESLPASDVADFEYELTDGGDAVEITEYVGNSEQCVIPSAIQGQPVTTIGNFAFAHCTALTNITIPNSVTRIGDYAFENCTSLTSITIPNSVISIGERAFTHCESLTTVYYGGSEADRAKMDIDATNHVLHDATWVYAS